jgi:hypothetical protein
MKNVFSFLAVSLTAASVFASPVPDSQLAEYKKAVAFSAIDVNLGCSMVSGSLSLDFGSFSDYVNQAQSAEISDQGQPLLIFNIEKSKVKSVVSVTTSSDFKQIVSVRVEESKYISKEVNKGSLRNPEFVVEGSWQTTAVVSCIPKAK